jgi:hypothetical protein
MQYSGLSMALCIAGAWTVNAYWTFRYFSKSFCVSVIHGQIDFVVLFGGQFGNLGFHMVPTDDAPGRLGFHYGSVATGAWVGVPLWFPLGLSLLVALVAWWSHRHRPQHACIKCEYDLTGNTSGVCPECGHRFALGSDEILSR